MNTAERRAQILALLEQNGEQQVRDLADRFSVSEMTVRRDLEHLACSGQLVRTYGGAMPRNSITRERSYAAKAVEHTDEKERIARRAAAFVHDGDMVLLDAGSTNTVLARALRGRQNLTVVTNDLKIALELCDEPGVRVLVTGGTAQKDVYSLLGPLAEQTLRSLTADIAFLGASAVDAEQGVTTPTMEKVPLKQAMIRAARRTVLLADSSKFGLRSSFQICPLSAISCIITDRELPPEVARSIQKGGATLELV